MPEQTRAAGPPPRRAHPLSAGGPVTGATWGGPQTAPRHKGALSQRGTAHANPSSRSALGEGTVQSTGPLTAAMWAPAACSVPQGTPALGATEGGAPLQSPWQSSVPLLLPVSPSPGLFPPPVLFPLPPGWALPVGTQQDTCRFTAFNGTWGLAQAHVTPQPQGREGGSRKPSETGRDCGGKAHGLAKVTRPHWPGFQISPVGVLTAPCGRRRPLL